MPTLNLSRGGSPASEVLCLGAHSDDIEIGCGGTMLTLLQGEKPPRVTWVVFSGNGVRGDEARKGAECFLQAAKSREVQVHEFRDGFFPYQGDRIKQVFEDLKAKVKPDVVFTHYRDDRHQDHRVISDLAWNTFRDHLVLEYEIPKWDGDLGSPNVFVPLEESICRRKIEALQTTFQSQNGKRWFTDDLFRSLMRLRGMECNAPSLHAEAFYGRKLVVS
jgi:LmbE family N-acetylglucosaminyl deacetylase